MMLTQQERDTIESGATCPQCGAWMLRCRCPGQVRPLEPSVEAFLERDRDEHLEKALVNFGVDPGRRREEFAHEESSRMGCD